MMTLATLYTHLHEISYFHAGAHHVCAVDLDGPATTRGRAGMVLGRVWFARAADVRYEGTERCGAAQEIAADAEQYAYTHGGDEYRAACRAIWAAIDAAKSGATVHVEPAALRPPPAPVVATVPELPSY